MKFGFAIDNRKCIGCHACTVACKSEHDVPIGVNRTWVKQTEKGTFPNNRRIFSVLRCNHCTDAPCVEICPVEALYIREDGIVDFNNSRCIGCKSCMQACPYDALYIDPESLTAAKCNYCAHRIDIGLEPACVNICPEHAIVSGDLDNPDSEIAQLISREQVTVRKPEKSTKPNVYYIHGDHASLTPSSTQREEQYIWSDQQGGVGHYARFMEKRAAQSDLSQLKAQLQYSPSANEITYQGREKENDTIINTVKRVYDTPDKGILWGWEVSAYVLTKAISSGLILILLSGFLLGLAPVSEDWHYFSGLGALLFLLATGILLVMDLDQPKRFLYVLLRPQWNSWLTRGGYAITLFGGVVSFWLLSSWLGWTTLLSPLLVISGILALVVSVYTAFLFAQAKGRDFWQSPMLALHMFIHSFMAGSSLLALFMPFLTPNVEWQEFNQLILTSSLGINLILIAVELVTPHPTQDAKTVVAMILKGRYSKAFYWGVILIGNIFPLLFTLYFPSPAWGLLVLAGIYVTERIWIEAPQRIPLT